MSVQAAFTALHSLAPAKRQQLVDAILVALDKTVAPDDSAHGSIAYKVTLLLAICPMRPKEMGQMLGIDAEVAVFKNALTSLRGAGVVETEGSKHQRMYRLTRRSK